jgi:hypothetical protein
MRKQRCQPLELQLLYAGGREPLAEVETLKHR